MPLTGRPGLAATHVLDPAWQYHHRPTSADAMPDECTIDRPSTDPVWDDTAGRNVYPDPARVYPTNSDGRCRITRVGVDAPVAGEPTTGRPVGIAAYLVAVPTSSALARINDIVTVVRCCGDPDLAGRELRVTNESRGSYTWERILTCELQPPSVR